MAFFEHTCAPTRRLLVVSAMPEAMQLELAPMWAAGTLKRREEEGDEERAKKLARGAKQATGQQKKDKLQELVVLLTKLVLINSTQIRELFGAVYSTHEVDGASGLAMAMKEAGNRYYEEVKDNPGHTLGPPFLHVWLALV